MRKVFLFNKSIQTNLIIYILCMVITIIGLGYGNAIKNDFTFLRVWDYQNVLLMLLGIPFLFLQTKANLPNFWEATIPKKSKWILPVLVGAAFGMLDVVVFKVIQHPEPYTDLPPFLQPFPYSLLLYFSGAFEIEIFYRLIPLTLMLLAGKWLAKGKYFTVFLWAGIVLTSLREPLEQLPDGPLWIIVYSLLTGFLMNFLQAWYYTKSGFLASLFVRLGHYTFWHILLGIYVQYFELA